MRRLDEIILKNYGYSISTIPQTNTRTHPERTPIMSSANPQQPLHPNAEVDAMLRQIRFTVEYPFVQYAPNATVCNYFNTFDDLKVTYDNIVAFYASLATAQATIDESKQDERVNVNVNVRDGPVTEGIVKRAIRELPYYLIHVRLVNDDNQIVRLYTYMSDSYRRIRRLTTHHMYHAVLPNNTKLYFDDEYLQCECDTCKEKGTTSSKSRFTSEFFDPYYLYMSESEYARFVDDIVAQGSTTGLRLKVRVYDNVSGEERWGTNYRISAPVEHQRAYNVTVRAHDAISGNHYILKTVESSYPTIAREVEAGGIRIGSTYYVRNTIDMKGKKVKTLMKIIDTITEHTPSYQFMNVWCDNIDSFTVSCGSSSVSYTELNKAYAEANNVVAPKDTHIQKKLSDSINERYVDDIEQQLRGYLVKAEEVANPKVSIVSSNYDDIESEPASPSMPPLESVVVSIPEVVLQRKVPHWVNMYHPVLFVRGETLRIVPTHNIVGSVALCDRVLYEPNSSMNCPIYWNERENAWLSKMSNRSYLESLLGEAVIQKVNGNGSGNNNIQLVINRDSVNTRAVNKVVKKEDDSCGAYGGSNQSKSGSIYVENKNTNGNDGRKRKTRVKVEHEESQSNTQSNSSDNDVFIPRRSTRIQMKQ